MTEQSAMIPDATDVVAVLQRLFRESVRYDGITVAVEAEAANILRAWADEVATVAATVAADEVCRDTYNQINELQDEIRELWAILKPEAINTAE